MTDKQIKIEVLLEDKNLTSGLKSIKSDLNSIDGSKFNAVQTSVSGASTAVDFLKTSLIGITAGFSFGSVINEFTRLENAGLELTKMTDELFSKDFQDRADSISKSLGKAKSEILETASGASALGVANEDLFEFTEAIIGGSIALTEYTGKSEDLARQTAGVSLQMNLAAKDTNKYLSVLNSVGDDSAASAQDISLFNERTASTGKSLGLTISELSAIGATFRDLGRPVEVASTAFNSYASALLDTQKIAENLNRVDPTKSVEEYNQRIQALKKEDPVGLFVEITSSLDDLGRQNVFGRQFADEFIAIGGASEKLKSNINNANKAFDEGTSVLKELAVQQTSLSSSLDRMKVKLIDVATAIGSLLAPIIKGLEPLITGLANRIIGLQAVFSSDAFIGFKNVISSIAGAFNTPFINEFIKNLTTLATYIGGAILVFIGFKTALLGIAGAFSSLSAVILANPIGASLVAIVAVLALLKAAWDANLFGIQDRVSAFYTFITDTWNLIKETTSTIWNSILQYFIDTWSGISLSFTSSLDTILGYITLTFDSIYTYISTTLDSVSAYVTEVISSIVGYISTALAPIVDYFTSTFTDVYNTVSNTLTSVYDYVVDIINSIKEYISNTNVSDAFSSMFSGVAGVVEDIFNRVVQIIADKINGIIDGIKKVGNFIRNIGAEGLSSIGDLLDNFGGFRALGGKVNKGVPYVVGEKGAELFIPNQNGTIIPNSSLVNNNQSSNNIVININGGSGVDANELARLVQERLLYTLKTRKYA